MCCIYNTTIYAIINPILYIILQVIYRSVCLYSWHNKRFFIWISERSLLHLKNLIFKMVRPEHTEYSGSPGYRVTMHHCDAWLRCPRYADIINRLSPGMLIPAGANSLTLDGSHQSIPDQHSLRGWFENTYNLITNLGAIGRLPPERRDQLKQRLQTSNLQITIEQMVRSLNETDLADGVLLPFNSIMAHIKQMCIAEFMAAHKIDNPAEYLTGDNRMAEERKFFEFDKWATETAGERFRYLVANLILLPNRVANYLDKAAYANGCLPLADHNRDPQVTVLASVPRDTDEFFRALAYQDIFNNTGYHLPFMHALYSLNPALRRSGGGRRPDRFHDDPPPRGPVAGGVLEIPSRKVENHNVPEIPRREKVQVVR